MNLREAKGYSYGARGSFSYTRSSGVFAASAPVTAHATVASILELDREIKGMWSGRAPVRNEELAREKLGAILGLPGRFATAQAALGQYRSLVYFGLPLDYFDAYVQHVHKISPADVMNAAAHQLRPGQAVYVVVGSGDAPQQITSENSQPTLREALGELARRGVVGSGGLVELDADGRLRN
jgi:predicted Zn-dependent peptidase